MKTVSKEQVLKKLGHTIAKKREAAKYTQIQVGERLGIKDEQVYRIERGAVDPGVHKLHVMARMFGCGIETFFVESSSRPIHQVERMLKMMEKLTPGNRQLVVEIVEKLTSELGKVKETTSLLR